MDTWLRDHLIRSGHMTEDGVTRKARIRRCPHCPRDVLVGLDSDICALEVHADPHPLSAIGEAVALLQNRRTLHLRRDGSGWVLDPRTDRDIAMRPAGTTNRLDVLGQHHCATGPPSPALQAPSSFPEAKPPVRPTERPPF